MKHHLRSTVKLRLWQTFFVLELHLFSYFNLKAMVAGLLTDVHSARRQRFARCFLRSSVMIGRYGILGVWNRVGVFVGSQ